MQRMGIVWAQDKYMRMDEENKESQVKWNNNKKMVSSSINKQPKKTKQTNEIPLNVFADTVY